MSAYIEGPPNGKLNILCDEFDAQVVAPSEVRPAIAMGFGVVCVVFNPTFESAGYAYDKAEAERFMFPGDHREKVWLRMNKSDVEQLVKTGLGVGK